MTGKRTTPELVEKVRKLAARKMSASEIADLLTSSVHIISRNAIAGIAHRNKIKLGEPRAARRPKPYAANSAVTPHVVSQRTMPRVSSFVAMCSWAGCEAHAEAGDMFCFSHGRRALSS